MRNFCKIFAVAALMMCLPLIADAQHLGIKGGVNFSNKGSGNKSNLGYQAGLTFQADLPLWFSIQPDLIFHVKGSRLENAPDRAFGLGYLELPVNIQWGPRFLDGDLRVFLQGSPFIGYAISKDMKDSSGKQYGWNNINRFEYGVGAGVGIQFRRIQLTGQYNWSLGDLVSDTAGEAEFKKLFSKANFGGYTISLAILLF